MAQSTSVQATPDGAIPVMLPMLPTESMVREYLERCDASRTYTNHGPLAQELEARYGQHLGVPTDQVVAVSSATIALQALLESFEQPTVTVPAYTFPATLHAAVQAKKRLVILDVSKESAVCAGNPHGGLSLVATPFGGPIDWSAIQALKGDGVVIDAAASVATLSGGLTALPTNSCVAISLHATKVLGAGEGGLAVCGSADQAAFVRRFINFGFAEGTRESMHEGTNGKMSEITAAYALAALDNYSIERREWLAHSDQMWRLTNELGVADNHFDPRWVTPYWIIRTPDAIGARRTQDILWDSHQVTSRAWWRNCVRMPAFQRLAVNQEVFEGADHLEGHLLGLPRFRGMTDAQFARIADALLHAFA